MPTCRSGFVSASMRGTPPTPSPHDEPFQLTPMPMMNSLWKWPPCHSLHLLNYREGHNLPGSISPAFLVTQLDDAKTSINLALIGNVGSARSKRTQTQGRRRKWIRRVWWHISYLRMVPLEDTPPPRVHAVRWRRQWFHDGIRKRNARWRLKVW